MDTIDTTGTDSEVDTIDAVAALLLLGCSVEPGPLLLSVAEGVVSNVVGRVVFC